MELKEFHFVQIGFLLVGPGNLYITQTIKKRIFQVGSVILRIFVCTVQNGGHYPMCLLTTETELV